jgi:hypothetical protein
MLRDQLIIGTALFVPVALLFRVARSVSSDYRERMRAADAQRVRETAQTPSVRADDAAHPLRKSA